MFLRLTTGAAHLLILRFTDVTSSPNHSEARAPQASTYTRRCLGFKKLIGLKRHNFFQITCYKLYVNLFAKLL